MEGTGPESARTDDKEKKNPVFHPNDRLPRSNDVRRAFPPSELKDLVRQVPLQSPGRDPGATRQRQQRDGRSRAKQELALRADRKEFAVIVDEPDVCTAGELRESAHIPDGMVQAAAGRPEYGDPPESVLDAPRQRLFEVRAVLVLEPIRRCPAECLERGSPHRVEITDDEVRSASMSPRRIRTAVRADKDIATTLATHEQSARRCGTVGEDQGVWNNWRLHRGDKKNGRRARGGGPPGDRSNRPGGVQSGMRNLQSNFD